MPKIVLKRSFNFLLIVVFFFALITVYYFLTSNVLIKDTFAISKVDTPNEEELQEITEDRMDWQYEFDDDGSKLIYPMLSASDKYVYAGINKTLHAIDKEDGDLTWEYSVPDMIVGKPVTVGDIVYVTAGNKLFAVDQSGESKWQYENNANIEPSLMMYNGILYFGTSDNKLYAVSQKGNLIWSIDIDGKILAPPVAAEDKLYFGDTSQHVYAVDVNNGQVIWKVSVRGAVQSTPDIYEDTLFFSSEVIPTVYTERENYLYAVSTQNGNLKWRKNTANLLTAPKFYNELVYVGDATGKLYTYEYRWGQNKWEFKKEDQQLAAPIIVNTTVFFQSNASHLYAVDIVTGNLLWEIIAEGAIKTPPLIDQDHTYFYCNGYLCALKNKV